ncbi:metallophosphoesterase [Leucobacter rhizosphaerae]|uniref:Metallophosphoesterase n=1 Tax=Leucobacter rhizosphaerae TaxID=2932245 RepID=A0ABY4FUV9_9MICO|nr:metallophosphoesterase [Leucobacter rhizosphaerae]UOQ60096.1 metallophosphoesterase [Leucobacter rhizosphaerae]
MSRDTGRFTVLHLSDVHATDSGLLYDAVDGVGRIERVGDYASAAGITPEAVVITGDLIERGHTGAYAAVGAACRRLEERLGVPVLTVLGNHDDPIAARTLPSHASGHFGAHHVDGTRVIRLDSHRRTVDAAQLEWLADELAIPAQAGTIVALHHAPIASPLPTLRRQGLANADALLDVLAGTDVRAILAGHYHHSLSASVQGIPVFVGPSLAYHQVMDAGPDAVAGHDSPMFSLVQFTSAGVSASTIALHSPEPLFTQPISSTAQKVTHVS